MPDEQPARTIQATGFDATVGLRYERYDGDGVLARLTVVPSLQQPYGIVHGGVYCTVVESAASVGAALWFGDRGNVVGVSNHTNFLRAVREGELTVVATPVQRGRTQQLWSVDVRDEQERLVAKGEVRIVNVADAGTLGQPAG